MADVFEHRDLSASVFRHVNLRGAVFEDVNLAGATIRHGFLADFTIEDAYIKRMTVHGFRVDLLIEAELDRRDPERLRLRMTDLENPECVRSVLKRLDEVREEFRTLVRSTDRKSLKTRPDPGNWSAVEVIRHLIFAEDLYTNRWLLGNTEPWCKLGLLPAHLANDPSLADVGREPTDDVEALFAAWDAIHASTLAFVAGVTPEELRRDTSSTDFGQGTVGNVLQGIAQHDLMHIRQAEAALAKCGDVGTG